MAILVLVENHFNIKAKDLANRLEVSTRTIYRDIESLCEAGFPLYATTGPNGGICFTEHYNLGISEINPNQILPLLLKTFPITSVETTNLSAAIIKGLNIIKQGHNLPSNNMDKINERVYIDPTSWWGEEEVAFNLELIIDALWNLKSIVIDYRKKDNLVQKRYINPYGLVIKDKTWYLMAYCNTNKGIRTFKCSHILKVRILKKHYQIPVGFSLKAHWTDSSQLFIDQKQKEEVYPVIIRILKHHAHILSTYEVYGMEEAEEYYVTTINLYKEEYAKDQIGSLIGVSEILSPEELRLEALTLLQRQVKQFQPNF